MWRTKGVTSFFHKTFSKVFKPEDTAALEGWQAELLNMASYLGYFHQLVDNVQQKLAELMDAERLAALRAADDRKWQEQQGKLMEALAEEAQLDRKLSELLEEQADLESRERTKTPLVQAISFSLLLIVLLMYNYYSVRHLFIALGMAEKADEFGMIGLVLPFFYTGLRYFFAFTDDAPAWFKKLHHMLVPIMLGTGLAYLIVGLFNPAWLDPVALMFLILALPVSTFVADVTVVKWASVDIEAIMVRWAEAARRSIVRKQIIRTKSERRGIQKAAAIAKRSADLIYTRHLNEALNLRPKLMAEFQLGILAAKVNPPVVLAPPPVMNGNGVNTQESPLN